MHFKKLMTNLALPYHFFLETEAKNKKTTKRDILEKSLRLYMRHVKRQEMIEAYKRMAKDTEYLQENRELAEMGMGEYFKIISRDDEKV